MRSPEEAGAYLTQAARRSCATSAPATATWRKAPCAPTSTSRCARPGERASARAARSRTSTRCASSCRRSSTRRAARSRSRRPAARSTRKPACSTPARGETRSMRSQGRRARLPLLPRSRPAAAGARRRPGSTQLEGQPAGTARRQEARASSRDYGLTPYDAGVLVAEKETAAFFEAVAKGRDAKLAANWVTGDLFAALNRLGTDHRGQPRSRPRDLGELLDLIGRRHASRASIAKEVFEAMVETGERARRDRRGARPEAGDRHRRHRGRDRRGAGRQRRQGRGVPRPARTSCSASSSAR